jgi:DNA-binding MarR family transcriptional regulator
MAMERSSESESAQVTDEPLLSYAIGRLDRAIRTRLAEVLAPFDLTVAQLTTLSVLARRPGLSNAQLARRAMILPQSMIQVISALESRGLILRTPAGGRTLHTRLTASGSTVVSRAERAIRALEAEMLGDDTDPEDAIRVMEAMRRWSEALAPRGGARI